MRRITAALAACLLFGLTLSAQTERVLFRSGPDSLFRIPALASPSAGRIVAIADYRHLHGSDVGLGLPLDIMARVSYDNGRTWAAAKKIISCDDPVYADGIYGFGDASIVADRKGREMMMLCVGDREGKAYWQRGRLEVHRFVSRDGGESWGEHSDLTDAIYSLGTDWKCLFIASGRIFQSRMIRKGRYYRLYCAALVADYGNAVLYSDDFGRSWGLLGGATSPCPDGDEAKIEELPDASVVLSSRTRGRYFNIFRYDDRRYRSGSWEGVVKSNDIIAEGNSTNGEILGLRARHTVSGRKCWLYLQSVPAGPGRSHVSIYYKEYCPDEPFADGWKAFEVTGEASSYSTMCRLSDGRIGFLYERKGADVDGLDIVFVPFGIEELTSGEYSALE